MEAPQSNPRTHTYDVTRVDLWMGTFAALSRSRVTNTISVLLLAFIWFQAFRAADLAQHSVAVRVFVALIIAGLFALVLAAIRVGLITLHVLTKDHKGVLGRHTITLADEGLVEKTEFNEGTHRWAGFHRLRETGRHLMLYVNESHFFLVPKRSFATTEAMNAFVAEVKRRSAKA